MFGVPRTDRKLGCDRKRRITCRLRIIESEIIDHLLDSNRAGRRHFACVEEPPHVGVRGCVDVDRERRERIRRDSAKWILVEVIVPFRMKVRVVPAGKIRRWCGHRRHASLSVHEIRDGCRDAAGHAACACDSHFRRLGGNPFRDRSDAHRDRETFNACRDAHGHHWRLESGQFESELVLAAAQLSKRERAACIGCCRVLFSPCERHSNAGQHASGDISHHAVNFAGARLRVHECNEKRRGEDRDGDARTHGCIPWQAGGGERKARTFGDAGNCLDTCAREMACA